MSQVEDNSITLLARHIKGSLNVLADFKPVVPEGSKQAEILMLGNLTPAVQKSVIEQMGERPKLIAMDTMNFWMEVALEELKEVMEEDFPVLVSTYLEDSVVRLECLKDAITQSDSEAIRKEAHSLKGSSGNLGANLLADLCKRLEEMGKYGEVDEAEPVYHEVVHEYAEVKTIMERFL